MVASLSLNSEDVNAITGNSHHIAIRALITPMKSTLADIRRRRLIWFLENRVGGNISELGRRMARSASFTHDLVSNRKSFGEKIARDLEVELRLPSGWLDQESEISPEAFELARNIERLSPADIDDLKAFIRVKQAMAASTEES